MIYRMGWIHHRFDIHGLVPNGRLKDHSIRKRGVAWLATDRITGFMVGEYEKNRGIRPGMHRVLSMPTPGATQLKTGRCSLRGRFLKRERTARKVYA